MKKYISIDCVVTLDYTSFLFTDEGWKTYGDYGEFQDITKAQYSKYGKQLEEYREMVSSEEYQQKRREKWAKYWENPDEYFKGKKEKKYSDECLLDL